MIKKKIALIFGVTGQDGSYLAKYLLKKILSSWRKRRSSSINTSRIDDIYEDPTKKKIIYTSPWRFDRFIKYTSHN